MSTDGLNKQTYLVSGQQTELIAASGEWHVDALFNNQHGQPLRWISDPYLTEKYGVNSSTVISYSFPGLVQTSASYNYPDDVGEITSTPFTSQQVIDIRIALKEVSKYINVTFVEVAETADKVGTLRFGINTITDESGNYIKGIAATATPPGTSPRGGDIFFNIQFLKTGNFAQGVSTPGETGAGDVTVLYHEIFHALGLEHPNDNNNIVFQEDRNSREYSVMAGAYADENQAHYLFNETDYKVASTPMVYDIAPLQHLYGVNTLHNAGDTIHTFDPETPFIRTLWDATGEDTLDFSNFSKNNIINLNGGTNSTIKGNSSWSSANILGLAYGIAIENANGGSGSDKLIGNSLGNVFKGNAVNDTIFGNAGDDTIFADGGSDSIDGGGGIDTVKYTLSQANYILALGETNSTIKEISTNTNDSFSTIERIVFADNAIALDIDGANSAGGIYRTYKAAFNRTPDKVGFGYWIDRADNGASAVQMAEGFVWSAEFQTLYGVTTSDNYLVGNDVEAVVDLFYRNVLGRAPDQGGLDYYASTIVAQDKTGGQVLAEIADSAENRTNLLSTLENGMNYDLWLG